MTTCRSALLRPLLLAALCLLAAPPAPAQDLDAHLPSLMEKGNVPGLSIAVLRDGTLAWSGAFGVRSTETGEPVDAQTVFEAASLSKPVFAFAVLRLAERGAFDLDAPLAGYLPYERLAHEPRYRQITARMVLSHSTGLPNWGGERLDLTFDPGTAWGYSGEGFVYLQKAVEHLTGLTLDALARREVFEPLGMTRSSFVWQDAFAGNAVARHSPQGEVEPIRRATEGNAAASLLTTAEDYARFLAAVVNGEGLRQETNDAMLTPVLSVVSSTWGRDEEARRHVSWGLGWGLHPTERGHAFWHWGDNGNAKAFTMTDLATGTGFVYFANSADGLTIAEAVAAMIFEETPWALRWLGYERYDDAGRLARLALQKTFAEEGIDAGVRRYEQLRAEQPDVLDERIVNRLGYELLGLDKVHEAVAVFRLNVAAYPASSNVYDSLGEALLAAGDRAQSLANYEKSVALDPGNENGKRYIAWIRARQQAEAQPVTVPAETLRRYAGDYGPRHVRLEGASLFYHRDDNPRYRLIPMARDTFALDGLETFRLRFVADEAGQVVKIVGLYAGGNQDETPRDASDGS